MHKAENNINKMQQKQPKFSFLSKEDNFSIEKYYNNISESQQKQKQSINNQEKTENEFFSLLKKNTRNDSITENFNRMFYPKDENLFRDYQFNIVKSCLLENTLVCLPTGMGKTFIASIIIYNFNLWFNGKIFFFAPTKPLVNQQKHAFTRLFDSLADAVCEINGNLSPRKRGALYAQKKIFFMTPQVFANDFKKEFINNKENIGISLLIFDEAHKAQKNYAYTDIICLVEAATSHQQKQNECFRVVGLSASPGASAPSIQSTLENLRIKKIEIRTEHDADLKEFLFHKKIELVEVDNSDDINKFLEILIALIKNRLDVLKRFKVIPAAVSAKYLGTCHLLKFQNEFKNKKDEHLNEIGPDMVREAHNIFSIVFRLLNAKKLLLTQGLESFKESIRKFENFEFEGKKSNGRFSSYNKNNNGSFYKSNCDFGDVGSFRRNSFGFFNNNNIKKKNKNFNFEADNNFDHSLNNFNCNKIKKYISPVSLAKKRLIESEDFQKLKRELFPENEENAIQKSINKNNNINSNSNNNCSNSTLYSNERSKNNISLNKENQLFNNNTTPSDFQIEIEIENKDFLANPYYNLFNNYKTHFKKLSSENKYANDLNEFEHEHINENDSSLIKSIILHDSLHNNKTTKKADSKLFSLSGEAHPKLKKLESLLLQESEAFKSGSKAIIFTQYIDSASEIKQFLEKNGAFCKSEISFEILKGQAKGYSQISQAETLRNFKDGLVNVLIATCVAEEGLDIEDVDLIVCYDIASSSPIKMIQRFGRTGRKKDGKVVVLCAKGEEKYKFFRAVKRLKAIQKDLKALKFEFEAVKVKAPQEISNVLFIDPLVVSKCEFFEVEKDAVDKASEDDFLLSETSVEDIEMEIDKRDGECFYDECDESENGKGDENNQNKFNLNYDNKNGNNYYNKDYNYAWNENEDEIFDFKKKGFVKKKQIANNNQVNKEEIAEDELIVISSDEDYENNFSAKDSGKQIKNRLSKQRNNADLYLFENAMQMLKKSYIKRESNSELPNLSKIARKEECKFYEEDELMDLTEETDDNKNVFNNKNNNKSSQIHMNVDDIKEEEEIEGDQVSVSNSLIENKANNKTVKKFKIFKRKSTDGRKYLTSSDYLDDLNYNNNNDINDFNDDFFKANNKIPLTLEAEGFKMPFPIKINKENKSFIEAKTLKENNPASLFNKLAVTNENNINNNNNLNNNKIKNEFALHRDNQANSKNAKTADSLIDKNKKANQVTINSFFKNKPVNPFINNLNQNPVYFKQTEESENKQNISKSNNSKANNINIETIKDPNKSPIDELTESQIMDVVNEVKEEEMELKINSFMEDRKIKSNLSNSSKKSSKPFDELHDFVIDLTNLEDENKNLIDISLINKKQRKSSNKKLKRIITDESIDELIKQNKTFFEFDNKNKNKINKTISNESIENLIEQNKTFFNNHINNYNNIKNSEEKRKNRTISDDFVMRIINENKTFFLLNNEKTEFVNNNNDVYENKENLILIKSNEKAFESSNKKPLRELISNSKSNKKENHQISIMFDKNIENYFSTTSVKQEEKINKNLKIMLNFHTNLKQLANKDTLSRINDENNPFINIDNNNNNNNKNFQCKNNFFPQKKIELTKLKNKKITEEHDRVFEKNITDKYVIGTKRKHSDILMTAKKLDNANNNKVRTIDAFFAPKKIKK